MPLNPSSLVALLGLAAAAGPADLLVLREARQLAFLRAVVNHFAAAAPVRRSSTADVAQPSMLPYVDAAGVRGDPFVVEGVEDGSEDLADDGAERPQAEALVVFVVLVGELVGGELPGVVPDVLIHNPSLPLEAGRCIVCVRVGAGLVAQESQNERVTQSGHRSEVALLGLSRVVDHGHDHRRFDPMVADFVEEHEDERPRIGLRACHAALCARAHEGRQLERPRGERAQARSEPSDERGKRFGGALHYGLGERASERESISQEAKVSAMQSKSERTGYVPR